VESASTGSEYSSVLAGVSAMRADGSERQALSQRRSVLGRLDCRQDDRAVWLEGRAGRPSSRIPSKGTLALNLKEGVSWLRRLEWRMPGEHDEQTPVTSHSLPDGFVVAVHERAGMGERHRACAKRGAQGVAC